MLKSDVITAINQEITANGVGAIDGPIMNTILMDIVGIIPDPYYKFPATSQLNPVADVGKLVMNNRGYAQVAMEGGNLPGQLGAWQASPVGAAVQLPGDPYIHTVLMSLSFSYVNSNGMMEEVYSYLQFSDVFDSNAPSGTLASDNYKYPGNQTEFADNLFWALQNLQLFATTQNWPITNCFDITRQGDAVLITQKFVTTTAEIVFNYLQNAPVKYVIQNVPQPPSEAFVQNPVLGVLIGVDGDHMALVDNREVVKVILSKDLKFQVNDQQEGFYGNIFYRLLKPVDGGLLAPIFPDTRINDLVDELSTRQILGGASFRSAGPITGSYTSFSSMVSASTARDESDLLRVNSTILYEALQEGKAGDAIYARRFSFLVPNGASFPIQENYGGYYTGYYY